MPGLRSDSTGYSRYRKAGTGAGAGETALLREYAQAHEYVVPEDWVFEDEGYSGSTLARPGLERLRDLAAEGLIETILVYAPDRLSRNYACQAPAESTAALLAQLAGER